MQGGAGEARRRTLHAQALQTIWLWILHCNMVAGQSVAMIPGMPPAQNFQGLLAKQYSGSCCGLHSSQTARPADSALVGCQRQPCEPIFDLLACTSTTGIPDVGLRRAFGGSGPKGCTKQAESIGRLCGRGCAEARGEGGRLVPAIQLCQP